MNDDVSSTIRSTLLDRCGVCDECVLLLTSRSRRSPATPSSTTSACTLCLGTLSSPSSLASAVRRIHERFSPYGGTVGNLLSEGAPTVVVPPLILLRARCILSAVENEVADRHEGSSPSGIVSGAEEVRSRVKERFRDLLRRQIPPPSTTAAADASSVAYTEEMHGEEAGYLNYHVVLTPPPVSHLPLPPSSILPLPLAKGGRKRERKRFRGNDPTEKQGGDPRVNLEKRVAAALEDGAKELEKKAVQGAVDGLASDAGRRRRLGEWFVEEVARIRSSETPEEETAGGEDTGCGIHVACWRNRFYLEGRYTKSRRDVSQTPFYVDAPRPTPNIGTESPASTNNGGMVRLGVTSVEEQICPHISHVACDGISTLNDEPPSPSDATRKAGRIVYGMCKFHASGREDMDVRMVLPPSARNEVVGGDGGEGAAGGRPFVCEVVDALRMPTVRSLRSAVAAVNHTPDATDTNPADTAPPCDVPPTPTNEWGVVETGPTHVRYGSNPAGVGISSLSYCPSSSHRYLQSRSEEKVKFYGCLCWSEDTIPDQTFLDDRLRLPPSTSTTSDESHPTPHLELHQKTPLRVLHRRATSTRTKRILSLTSVRIDDHWFRIRMSTSAGTYVKEFVHGDCGRTVPSVGSLLGCKVDIVELDCEGVAVG